MKKPELIICHYRELSKYPPILNLKNYLNSRGVNFKIISAPNLSIKLPNSLSYFWFTINALFKFFFNTKASILYYESVSAIPVRIYFLIFPYSKKKLFIHFHEYFSPQEYLNQSFLERIGRKLEVKLFNRAHWISHTNKDRLNLFKNENPYIDEHILEVLPNYPPSEWLTYASKQRSSNSGIIKLVHIGSLSNGSLYLEELLARFGNDPKYTIDFYSHKFTNEVNKIISLHDNCAIKGTVAYRDLPSLKGQYDVGLVLYKGLSLNFTYNAPNKIFEYLALNFDVWCSNKLLTAKDYVRYDCYPKLIMVDYENLKDFDVSKAIDKNGLHFKDSPYICEPVYEKLVEAILK